MVDPRETQTKNFNLEAIKYACKVMLNSSWRSLGGKYRQLERPTTRIAKEDNWSRQRLGTKLGRIHSGVRIYYYILAVDDGFAPCVDNGILSLAICKPAIRRTADQGDWIIGISPKEDEHKLVYAANVTRTIPGQKYYTQETFRQRGDRIYSFDGTRFTLRKRRKVHKEADRKRDVGKFPTYQNAVVLKSSRRSFWYYGDEARKIAPAKYPALNRRLNYLQQGHRVQHSPKVHKELLAIIKWLSRQKPGVYGKPRDPPSEVSHDSTCSKHHGTC